MLKSLQQVCACLVQVLFVAGAARGATPATNLALGKPASASTEEANKGNLASRGNDGNLATRWCARHGDANWYQVNLETAAHVRGVRIHWENPKQVYSHKLEASPDGQTWRELVANAESAGGLSTHLVDAANTRYLRVTITPTNKKVLASLCEIEVYADDMPEVAQAALFNKPPAEQVLAGTTVPDEFQLTLFGGPPQVNYPVCLAASPAGEVFVGVDENGSLGKVDGYGKVLKLVDTDHDGSADQITEFAKMRHPRGLFYDNGSLWVLHPPHITLYRDTNGDGVADHEQRLVEGISTEQHVKQRGADHTTNGIRVGIDGWIYIAVGDFGYHQAIDASGQTHQLLGGGIARMRSDGTELEVYVRGTRNNCDMAIDPLLNVFTRDNTNDGGGWNVRVSHLPQSAHMGYPSLYKNFSDEMYPTMQDMGGGSGTGALFIDEPTLPAPYDKALITVDWGRNEIYRQPLASNGAGFTVEQQLMLKTPRPTDIDIDASGRLYVSSWKDGGFSYSGPNVGFVACLTPKHATPAATPNFQQASDAQLLQLLAGPSHVIRTHAQWELLRRGDKPELAQGLEQLATQAPSLEAKVAAIFTLKQLQGAKSHAALVRLAQAHADIREWALRALTDRKSQLEGVPATVLVKALQDTNPRVRAQAAISLGRLGDAAQGAAILPLTADADATVRHVALRALAALQPTQALLNAVTAHDSAAARGALQALRYVHQAAAVEGLIAKVESVTDPALRREVLTTLTRLYYQEGEWPGDWWGTRPDTTGPYYRRAAWSETPKIEAALAKVLATADAETVVHLRQQIQRHSIKSTALEPDETSNVAATGPSVDLTKLLSSNQVVPDSIATLSFEDALKQTLRHNGDAQAGAKLYVSQGCVQCHTISPDQKPLGPMLRDISKRYNRTELVTSILKPSDKIAQGFATTTIITADGQLRSGIVASEGAEDLTLLAPTGQTVVVVKEDIEDRAENTVSTMPEGLANNLTPAQLASLLAFLETLKSE